MWPTDVTLIIFTTFTLVLEIKLFISLQKLIYLITLDTNSLLSAHTITRRNVQKVTIQINAIAAQAPKAIMGINGEKKEKWKEEKINFDG